ncbi:hypothetical protein M441DRAFT_397605 [Trichoderma asperellum CBS 433.97]|uniref:Uncharacterized protein n=1 Tax=Trichoderma asperellum (strain ATCC 204424 / CBS 433.97 / NBRC 101777) TaxID=1042311 RepID=A0A2T3Z9B8_TRIA4|nr:hypothetical protein M441DRAFT_397605 [Trichoderma asperellum CBS 433.97]PTB41386.1 hypothetical protein M441DRAFT_397605 [Trichoderma asperellum CBS 433.97]
MPRPAGRFSGAPTASAVSGLSDLRRIVPSLMEIAGTSTALALQACRELQGASPTSGASAPPACCYTLTLALRGIAAAYLRLQCLDPARVGDTLIPRGVDGSIDCPLSHGPITVVVSPSGQVVWKLTLSHQHPHL